MQRLIAPARKGVQVGIVPTFLTAGIAAAFHFDNHEDTQAVSLQQQLRRDHFDRVLQQVSQVDSQSDLGRMVASHYHLSRR